MSTYIFPVPEISKWILIFIGDFSGFKAVIEICKVKEKRCSVYECTSEIQEVVVNIRMISYSGTVNKFKGKLERDEEELIHSLKDWSRVLGTLNNLYHEGILIWIPQTLERIRVPTI